VIGVLVAADPDSRMLLPVFTTSSPHHAPAEVSFTECRSGLMAISRNDFKQLGMMLPLAVSGSSIWCDVEFGFRAHRNGFSFIIVPAALAMHYDHAERNLQSRARRMFRAAWASVLLFERHPPIREHLPMFRDMTPVAWRRDPPAVVLRKLVRPLASARPALRLLERAYAVASAQGHPPLVCRALERWIVGGYIFCGYRQGLRDFAPGNRRLARESESTIRSTSAR
jgi:GT2 family glycosyltransferase